MPFLLIPAIFVFLPFFANQNLLLNRNNDLTEFFWPIFYYLKQNILINHQIPYWNNVFFAETPLLPDPQNPIWYLPNSIFLLTDVNAGIIASLFMHTVFGSIGMFIVATMVFRFSKRTSIIVASIFTLSPIYFSYLEAGHWGLIIVWNLLPYLILSSYKLAAKPSWKYVALFVASASSIYFNHVVTAGIAFAAIAVYWLYKRSIRFPFIAIVLTALVLSPVLILQFSWLPNTTRQILLQNPETFPVWRGKREFIKTIFVFNPETEKAITFGAIPSILASYGFSKLRTKKKLLLILFSFLLLLVILNNVSPVFPNLLKIDFFVLMRVATRVWFLIYFILLFLFGYALEKSNKYISIGLGIFAIIESTTIGYSYLLKPIIPRNNVPEGIYKILGSDKSDFKVLCLTRCIPQKEAAIRNLKLTEGYGTLQSLDYYFGMQKALNATWNKYTLSIPPFDVYLYQDIQPNAEILSSLFNTKYVIAKTKLKDKNFKLLAKFGLYYVYENYKENIKSSKPSSI